MLADRAFCSYEYISRVTNDKKAQRAKNTRTTSALLLRMRRQAKTHQNPKTPSTTTQLESMTTHRHKPNVKTEFTPTQPRERAPENQEKRGEIVLNIASKPISKENKTRTQEKLTASKKIIIGKRHKRRKLQNKSPQNQCPILTPQGLKRKTHIGELRNEKNRQKLKSL